MCGRYVLGGDAADYAEYFGVDRIVGDELSRSYNVAPTDPVYTVASWDGERLLGVMRWGLIPHWAKDSKAIQINARAETLLTKPMFRDSAVRKRCIIPADGFYEWEPKERGRAPHWVYRADGFPMGFAGVYSSWKNPETEEWIRTCAIVTGEARGVISDIHERMPIALSPDVWDPWLDRSITDPSEIENLIQAIPPDLVMQHEVSPLVNSVRNNDRNLTNPAGPLRIV
ncbi:MAG: SOS response-associated peptidase [Acidimicrobiia bacterium]|nr:SOS response-associated peptidase [Acidimicrobiia bacterium]